MTSLPVSWLLLSLAISPLLSDGASVSAPPGVSQQLSSLSTNEFTNNSTKNSTGNTGTPAKNLPTVSPQLLQCRQNCLAKINETLDVIKESIDRGCPLHAQECFVCWSTCRILDLSQGPTTSEALAETRNFPETRKNSSTNVNCSDNTYCTTGCQIACTFYQQQFATFQEPATTEQTENDATSISSDALEITTENIGETTQTAISEDTTISIETTSQFSLQLMSLSHQGSLVLAELDWNNIWGDSSQEFLVTWELIGGGLKGHLVTDSPSVTLSLWPNTQYLVQVMVIHPNFSSDENNDSEETFPFPSSFQESLPFIVDTSLASFQHHHYPQGYHPLALENDETDTEYSYSEETEEEDDNQPENQYKSKDQISNSQVLLVALISVIIVIALLSLVAFARIKLQKLTPAKSSEKEPVVGKLEDSNKQFGDNAKSFRGSCFTDCFSFTRKSRTENKENIGCSQESLHGNEHVFNGAKSGENCALASVAVIGDSSMDSSASEMLHCYYNSVFSYSNSDLTLSSFNLMV